MTKEQLIKEFREKFVVEADDVFIVVANEDELKELETFLLSAFDAGRASGIEELRGKARELAGAIDLGMYQARWSQYDADERESESLKIAEKFLSSLTPSSSCENHTIYSESCVACQKSNELTPSSSKDN